jgi:hypothetical protein
MSPNQAERDTPAPSGGRSSKGAVVDKMSERKPLDPPTFTYGKDDKTAGATFGRHNTMPILVSDIYREVVLPDLNMFNLDDIKLDATLCFIGKRRTGKSWAMRNILFALRDKFQGGIVISQTAELNHFWEEYIPKAYIHTKYDPEIIQSVFKRQKKILNDHSRTEEEKERDAPFFVLLDDVISDTSLKYDESLMEIFVAGRHYKIFLLISTQYAKAVTPVIRANTDFVFCMKCIQQRQIEALWEDFGSFLTKDAFAQILAAYTEDNEVLVINTCPDTRVDPMSMLAWWKAIDPGKFHVGSAEFWRQAQLTEASLPPTPAPTNVLQLMTVKDVMPKPFKEMNFER